MSKYEKKINSRRAVQIKVSEETLEGIMLFMEMERRTSFGNACEILIDKALDSLGLLDVAKKTA